MNLKFNVFSYNCILILLFLLCASNKDRHRDQNLEWLLIKIKFIFEKLV